MCESPEQHRKKEEARAEAIRTTHNVNATGEKHSTSDPTYNQIDNE